VVNLSEGEPASRKDQFLAELRPNLIVDGALVAATAVGASDIIFYVHDDRHATIAALETALAQVDGTVEAGIRIVRSPSRYVAGESSAVVSYLEGNGAVPRRRRSQVAVNGVHGRPTVVNNAETIAHLALIARRGANWFTSAGVPSAPGSTLITVAGEVATPGAVAELLGPTTVGHVLRQVGGLVEPPRAVLFGGYAGTWLRGDVAWETPIDPSGVAGGAVSLGCGLIAVVGQQSSGLATTRRLLSWLAGESAGQCGPCISGLPTLVTQYESLVASRFAGADARELWRLMALIRGRGACAHPTGVVMLLESALDAFSDELRTSPRRRRRGDAARGFPIP
jgi:NADH:ubiquinone oxidoreductase subunit F (NADH-binding)